MSSLLVFIRVYRLGIQSVILVFLTQLCELCCPLTISLIQLLPPYPPFLCQSTVYTDSVWLGRGGGGVESCWRPNSAGVKHSVSDQIQNLQNCLTTPNKRLRRGRGLRQIKTCMPQSPFTGKFF